MAGTFVFPTPIAAGRGDGKGKDVIMEKSHNNQQDRIIQEIQKLPMELRGVAFIELFAAAESGRKINDLKAFCRAIVAREDAACGFVSLDEEEEGIAPLHGHVVAPIQDELELWRVAQVDEATEKILDEIRDGGAGIGRRRGLSARRGQQLVSELIARVGEGPDLFGWGGA